LSDQPQHIIESADEARALLKASKRIAVLGIKPETHRSEAAHYVPAFLQARGVEIVPVPVYYPEVTEILGERVHRKLIDVPGDVDMVIVFRRPRDVPPHVDDIIAKGTKTVWMQLGIYNDEAAARLSAAGINVVQDRCAMIDWK
jgi:predicted CoA-binding protein